MTSSGSDAVTRLAIAWLQSATRPELAIGAQRLAHASQNQSVRDAIAGATDRWLLDILQAANRPTPESIHELTDDEQLFVQFIAGSELGFERVTAVALAAYAGRSPLEVLTGKRRWSRALEIASVLAGQADLPPEDLRPFIGGYLARLLAMTGRLFGPDLTRAVTSSAIAGLMEGWIARFIRDFQTVCQAKHETSVYPFVEEVVECLHQLMSDALRPLLLTHGMRAICHLPNGPIRHDLLQALVELARPATGCRGAELDSLIRLWENSLDFLWSDADVLRLYLDLWRKMSVPVPADHLTRLGNSEVAAFSDDAFDLIMGEADSGIGSIPRLFVALSRTGVDIGEHLVRLVDQAGHDPSKLEIVMRVGLAWQLAWRAGRLDTDVRRVQGSLYPPLVPARVVAAAEELASGAPSSAAIALLAMTAPRQLLETSRRLTTRAPDRADELLATAAIQSPYLAGRVAARLISRKIGGYDAAHRFLKATRQSDWLDGGTDNGDDIRDVLELSTAEGELALSMVNDPLVGLCTARIASAVKSPHSGSNSRSTSRIYLEAMLVAPRLNTAIVDLALEAVRSQTSISPADMDDHILTMCRPSRTKPEREVVWERLTELLALDARPRADVSAAVVTDYTGMAPREVMTAIALLGVKSALTDDEADKLVFVANTRRHPWITVLVIATLCSQARLGDRQLTFLERSLRPPSASRDFFSIGFRSMRRRLSKPKALTEDWVPGAQVTQICVAAKAIGSLLERANRGQVYMPPGSRERLVRSLSKVGATGILASARWMARRSMTDRAPLFIAIPFGFARIRPEALDPMLLARAALTQHSAMNKGDS